MHRSTLRLPILALLLASSLLASGAPAGAAPGGRIASNDLIELNSAVQDTNRAPNAIPKIRSLLAEKPDSLYTYYLRQLLLSALVVTRAPSAVVVGAADSVLALPARDPLQKVLINGEIAQYLVNRGEQPARALHMARTAFLGLPADPRFDQLRGFALGTLGEAFLANNRPDSAVFMLETALRAAPDTQRVLTRLGRAYESQGRTDKALDAHLRAAGVFLGRDTSLASLRTMWGKKHGSLAGLDAEVAKRRAAGRKAVALDAHRHERPAPEWALPDLDGKTVRSTDFKGKVVVLDFWGTWCGPCRVELPIFQRIVEKYRGCDVVFLGVNWERAVPGPETTQKVRDYLKQNGLDFPTVLDSDRSAQIAFDVEGFPCVFMIDRTGKVRYKNVGVADGIEHILTAQIDSLLE